MGFGTIVSALVAVAAILLASYVFTLSGFLMTETLSESVKDMYDHNNEVLKTEIKINDITSDGANIYLTLNNTGNEKIRTFANMDVIVHYYNPSDELITLWLPYTNGTPNPDEWTVSNILPNNINPGIFDSGEEMTIWIKLQSPVKMGSTNNWLRITTPNGVSASKYFDR